MAIEAFESWPGDLQLVFTAIGRAMDGGRLRPEILSKIPTLRSAIVPDHSVWVSHISKTEIMQPAGRYRIELHGDRWKRNQWLLRSGDLESLCRDALARTPP